MPEEAAPQPEEAAPAPAAPEPQAPSADAAPIVRGYRRARELGQTAAQNVVQTATSFKEKVRATLRFEHTNPEEVGFFKTIPVAAGHVLDGTALNLVRRCVEVLEPTASLIRQLYRCTIGKVLHPIHTVIHPVETIKDFVRLGTSAIKIPVETAMAAVRIPDDVVDRSVANTTEQVNFKTAKVPLIGKLWAKTTNWIAGLGRKISNGIRAGVEWLKKPLDYIHDGAAPA